MRLSYSTETRKFYKEVPRKTAERMFNAGKIIVFASCMGLDDAVFRPLHLTKEDFSFSEIISMCKQTLKEVVAKSWTYNNGRLMPHFYVELPPDAIIKRDDTPRLVY